MAEVVSPEELAEAGLRLDVEGEIATISLNRPERRNALTFATWSTLARIGETLPGGVRIVVVRGEGKAFSAGLDVSVLTGDSGGGSFQAALDGGDSSFDRFIATVQAGYAWLRRPDIITIAAVHGYAIGGGFQLALACDLRVLADDARFCMKESAYGLVPDLTGTKPLVDIVGLPRALELCVTARFVDAAEAKELRLAELVVPRDELDGAVSDLVAALLATSRDTATATKRLLQGASRRTLEEQCAAERIEQLGRIKAAFAKR